MHKDGAHTINWDNGPIILLPIIMGPHSGGHSSLLVVERTHYSSASLFLYFDSLPSTGKDIDILELEEKLKSMPLWKDGSIFKLMIKLMINPIKLMPIQSRGASNDCGIFTCCSAAVLQLSI
jgi:hypothetical protein